MTDLEKAQEEIAACRSARETSLTLVDLELGTIPDEVFELTWLKYLDLDSCELTDLSPKIAGLKELKTLDVSRNRLTELPPEIGQLANLTDLYLSENLLTTLPPEIGQLINLTNLVLSKNQLTTLPPEIGQLTSLTGLDFGSNQLTTLPPEIGKLANLTDLSLSENLLTTLPPEIGKLNLQSYSYDEDDFAEPLAAALWRDWNDVKAYLRGLADSQKCYEAKLVLVGEGNVGKTSLVGALKLEDFVENRSTTHGIEVREFDVPHPGEAEVKIRLNSWDFGGQAVYRITHQFFFSRRSLFLVVWWPREGVEQNDVEGWIERIQLRVGDDARVLVVASHCTEHGRVPRINQEALKRRFGDIIVGFHAVDSREMYRIDELKTAIAQAASQLPQMGEDMPTAWQRVREEIRALKDVQIPMSTFREVCAKHELEDDAIPALANLMNDLGDVVYFSDVEGLSETMILNPEWLTKAIGYVLEDQRTNSDAGMLAWNRLHEIWSSDRPDREKYDRTAHPFFLRLMEQFDISYRLGDSTSLVGQLVPADEPAEVQPWRDAAQSDDLVLVCRLSADAPGLIPWLIVRTHWYSQDIHWQNGMLLNHGLHGEALMELVGRNLQITVRAAYPTYFADILKDTADFLIEDRWPGLQSRWAVPCFKEGCSGLLNLSVLKTRQQKKESEVSCLDCGEDLQIGKLLEAVPVPPDEFEPDELLPNFRHAPASHHSRFAMALRTFRKPYQHSNKGESRYVTCIPDGNGAWLYRGWCQMPGCEHPVSDWNPHSNCVFMTERPPTELVQTAVYPSILKFGLKHAAEHRSQKLVDSFKSHFQEFKDAEFEWPEFKFTNLQEIHTTTSMYLGFTDLQRVRAPDGEYLWVCDEHHKLFDPGLPEIPKTEERVTEPVVRPFSLKSIRIRNFRSIDDLTIPLLSESQLPGTWTCLAGINGAGKTAILEAIALVMLGPQDADLVGAKRLGRMVRRVGDKARSMLDLEVEWAGVGTVKLSISIVLDENGTDARVPSTGDHDDDPDGLPHQLRLLTRKHLFLSYGATRNLSDEKDGTDGEDAEIVERQRTLFRPLAHIRGVNALLAGGEENAPVLRTLFALIERLFDPDDRLCAQKPTNHEAMAFGDLKQRLDSFQLPDGYRSTIGWLADLCAEWHRINREAAAENDFEKMSGLVLVDEIDLHLHPKLQWDLVSRLRRLLPHVQFIVTTHSPMVLTSFDQHELILLEQKNDRLGIRLVARQIIGFTMNEVYRWLLGPEHVAGGEFARLDKSDDPQDQELVTRLLYQSDEVNAEEADRRLAAHERLAQAKRDEQDAE
ncbi:MAG: leucine-rich repeat domain-containing protein [Planctomycetota bacterium]|nr:leucine-rich repeat domain-containing protein [Planctomycetota bacterium]MDA1158837.1 leucine-rich repeat domain-containing protein [Planctomycetota bacterium]